MLTPKEVEVINRWQEKNPDEYSREPRDMSKTTELSLSELTTALLISRLHWFMPLDEVCRMMAAAHDDMTVTNR